MLKKYCEELYLTYREELRTAWFSEKGGLQRLTACLAVVRLYLKLLKEYVAAYAFTDKAEEIWLFKVGKPLFYQWQIYYLYWYALENQRPVRGRKPILKYYGGHLDDLDRFFRLHEFHYQYYKLGATELDELYFVRGAEVQHILVPEVPEVDPAFSTSMDYLFSKFMAYEELKKHVATEMSKLDNQQALSATTVDEQGNLRSAFRWTGEVINLIEVAHAIYLNKQVNEGEIGINEFFEVLGAFFGVNLGVPKSGFEDLMARKRLSKTHFTDKSKDALLKKMDEEIALKTHKAKNKGGL
jgi:hypothetical protein